MVNGSLIRFRRTFVIWLMLEIEAACKNTHYQTIMMIGTLAAAYAEAGRFDDAIAITQKACAMATEANDQPLLQNNQRLRDLYLKHQPYHESPTKADQ